MTWEYTNLKSATNTLILLASIITTFVLLNPDYLKYWINDYFLSEWKYHIFTIQLFFWACMHGWIFHLLWNSIALFLFWNIVEKILWNIKYLLFILWILFFNGIIITILSNWNTVWLSWLVMALLWFYAVYLYKNNDKEYKWWITAMFLYTIIWLLPQVSFIWHLSWALLWIFYWYVYYKIKH